MSNVIWFPSPTPKTNANPIKSFCELIDCVHKMLFLTWLIPTWIAKSKRTAEIIELRAYTSAIVACDQNTGDTDSVSDAKDAVNVGIGSRDELIVVVVKVLRTTVMAKNNTTTVEELKIAEKTLALYAKSPTGKR